MICLRLWRPSAAFGHLGLTCALLFAICVFPGPWAREAHAASRSRTHRVVPALAPLHYTERSFAVPRNHKAGGKHDQAPSAGVKGAKSATHPSPARKGGHTPASDPYDRVPMHRAARDTGPVGTQLASRSHLRGRTSQPAPETMVAEVTGRSSHGEYLAQLHGKGPSSRGASLARGRQSGRSVVVADSASPDSAFSAPPRSAWTRSSPPAPVERHPGAPSTATYPSTAPYPPAAAVSSAANTGAGRQPPSVAYASGVSDPGDDRRSSTYPATSQSWADPRLPTVSAIAAAPSTAQLPRHYTPPASSQVIGGFGSEIALAPATPASTPEATRRRNHPIPASALPEDVRPSLPVTLEDREAITEAAVSPAILPDLYDRDGRLLMPAPLKGSREVLVHQNTMADSDGLERIQNDAELNHLRATHQLVDLPASGSLRVNDDLPYNRRAARPWTALFTQDIARDYYARFHQPLWVTSAVRTVAFQSHLLRVNGNAAGLYGDFASPHLTGQAVDFGKRGMSSTQLAWMRAYLMPLIQSGKIDVEEEFQQACFHISVYRRYAGNRHLVTEYVQAGGAAAHAPPPPPYAAEIPPPQDTQSNP